jgi:hypothetical protein
MIPVLLLTATLAGCGDDEPSGVPADGEPLKKHLLGMMAEKHEAMLAGDAEKVRSFLLPYMRDEQRATAIYAGWDPDVTRIPQEVIDDTREKGPAFAPDLPVTMDTHGAWARLVQERTDDLGEAFVVRVFFLRDEGRWWIVDGVRDYTGGAPEGYGFTQAKYYWPDRMAEYFFLPPVELKLELVGKADAAWEDFRVRAGVRNVSGRPISALQMRRFFTVVNYRRGQFTTGVEPRGKGQNPGFEALPPGETVVLGEFDVSYPTRDPDKGLLWKVSRYLSNRLILPGPTD